MPKGQAGQPAGGGPAVQLAADAMERMREVPGARVSRWIAERLPENVVVNTVTYRRSWDTPRVVSTKPITLVDVMIAMALMSVLLAVFTTGIVEMYRTVNNADAASLQVGVTTTIVGRTAQTRTFTVQFTALNTVPTTTELPLCNKNP